MKTKSVVVDASYVLSMLFPDENGPINYTGCMIAPTILRYEVTNAMKMGVVRKRIDKDLAHALLKEFEGWRVEYRDVTQSQVLDLAIAKNLSVYDASYVWLAGEVGCELLTWDERLVSKGGT